MSDDNLYYRAATLERTADKKKVRMSISSDEPCLTIDSNGRRFYEVLDHSRGGFDDSRLRSGLPVLYNHKRDILIGKGAPEYNCDGKRIQIDSTFSESESVRGYVSQVDEGVLTDTSVGYRLIGKGTKIGEHDGAPILKFRWLPFEVSMVPVPMDHTTGIGRSIDGVLTGAEDSESFSIDAQNEGKQARNSEQRTAPKLMSEQTTETLPKIDVVAERNTAVTAERNRVKSIHDLSRHFAEKGLGGRKIDTAELANQYVAEGKTEREFQDAVVRGNFNEVKPVQTQADELGMSEKEKRSFSFVRCLRLLSQGKELDGLEAEANRAHAKIVGKEAAPLSFYIPQDVWNTRAFPNGINEQQRALFTNVFSGAGAFVGTDLLAASLIELFRNQMFTMQLGARSLSGLVGNVAIPRQTGGATASWLAEDSTASSSQQTVGQLNLTPHNLVAMTAYSAQLLAQSSVDVENFVRQDLMAVMAIERDRAAINGSGVQGEPQGIIGMENGSTLSTKVTLSATQSMSYLNAVTFETNLAVNNADKGKLGYMTTPTVRGRAKITPEFSSTAGPIWRNDTVNGYPARATNQMPTTTGSTIFGNWDDLILADWANSSVLVDPYSLSAQRQIRVIHSMFCDNGVRHGKSFAISVDS